MKLILCGFVVLAVSGFAGCGGGGGGGGGGPAAVDVTGTWTGTWASQNGINTGSIDTTLAQTGNTISGSVTFTGSPCFAGGPDHGHRQRRERYGVASGRWYPRHVLRGR